MQRDTIVFLLLGACSGASARSERPGSPPGPPSIDRFSRAAGHLMVRDASNKLPAADQPIDLDRPPFVTEGLGPDGAAVRYYNFDVQPDVPATLYRLTRAGAHEAIPGELDVVDAIPGEAGYSDFWRIAWVTVPDGLAPGSITSAGEIRARHLAIAEDAHVIDCPIVPRGTTGHAGQMDAPVVATELWYRGARVTCLAFGEPLTTVDGRVPTSPIYVSFARNPGTADGGPASGFRTEPATPHTHNVVFSLPGDVDYSPLWAVHIYDRSAFDAVHDAETALHAPLLVPNGPHVNCPIVSTTPR